MATFRDGARNFKRRRAVDVLRTVTNNYATQIAGHIARVAPVDQGYLQQHINKDTADPFKARVFTLVPYAPYPQTYKGGPSRKTKPGERRRRRRRPSILQPPRRRARSFPPYWTLGQKRGAARARQQNAPALREWLRGR